MSTSHTVTLPEARAIIAAATAKAEEIGQPMNIAVVCAGGHLLASERMHGAWIGSVDISQKKAWSGRLFAGGIPLERGGVVIGAIGVSGGLDAQDQAVAEAGAAAL